MEPATSIARPDSDGVASTLPPRQLRPATTTARSNCAAIPLRKASLRVESTAHMVGTEMNGPLRSIAPMCSGDLP